MATGILYRYSLIHIVRSMSCIYICRHLENEHLVCLIHITSAITNIINSE